MADHPDEADFLPPEPRGETPHPSPDADFPADFFDDFSEASPNLSDEERTADPDEPPTEAERSSAEAWASEEAIEPIPLAQPAPARPAQPVEAPAQSGASRVFPVVVGLAMVGVVAGALGLARSYKLLPAPGESTAASVVPDAPPAPSPTDVLAGEIKALKGQLEALRMDLGGLAARVDGLPEPPPPTDLKPIQARLDGLAKSAESVSRLDQAIEKFDERLGKLAERAEGYDAALKETGERLSALDDDLRQIRESAVKAAPPAAAAVESPSPAAEEPAAQAVKQGGDLFASGKYQEASDLFNPLVEAKVKDARVYYYRALANGMTSGDWKNETLKIATLGAEQEKAGNPPAAEIDATFANLPDNLKPWIAYFRKLAP